MYQLVHPMFVQVSLPVIVPFLRNIVAHPEREREIKKDNVVSDI